MIKVGLVGMPNSGKTTLFNALCEASAEVAPYPFTTKNKNIGSLFFKDKRLKELSEFLGSSKITPAQVEVVDVAGLIKGAHKGEGLGNEFLSYIRPLDAFAFVLRMFEGSNVPHSYGYSDPQRDLEILRYEIAMSDLSILERKEENLQKAAKRGDKEASKSLDIISRLKEKIETFSETGEFKTDDVLMDSLSSDLICKKPYFLIINTDIGKDKWKNLESVTTSSKRILITDAVAENELIKFSEEERDSLGEEPFVYNFTAVCLEVLGMISFFTGFRGGELRAHFVKNGTNCYEAAGLIHSDIQKGFISADVMNYSDAIMKKEKFMTVGKDYVVKDGDLIRIKFSK